LLDVDRLALVEDARIPPGDEDRHTQAAPRSGKSEGHVLSRFAEAGALCGGLFLFLTLPRVHWGPVIGTGQDDWYNVVRALRALYELLNPSYFIHPALYYEFLAVLCGLQSVWLSVTGKLAAGVGLLDYFLVHEWQFLDLARCASLSYGALAVVAAVWLGGVLSGPSGGLLAGLIVASLPLLQELAICIRVDTLALAALIGATALVVRCHQNPSRRSLFAAATAIGVAAAANYPGALLLLLLGWLWLSRSSTATRKRQLFSFGQACALAFAVFLLLNPYVVIDFPLFLRWFTFQGNVALLTHPHADEPSVTRYLNLLIAQGPAPVLASIAAVLATSRPRKPIGALAVYGLMQFVAFSLMRSQYDRFVLPAITLLCIAGAAWVCAGLARIRPWVPQAFNVIAIPLVLWWAGGAFRQPLPGSETERPDYRLEMFEWIAAKVPPSATLVIESDTMPLLQIAYGPADQESTFQDALQQAFERLHPGFVRKIIKCQFIAAVYNYDRTLLDSDDVFFLASSQNRDFIDRNRVVLPEPAAFYSALDTQATLRHASEGIHETLLLYSTTTRDGVE
jgi:hypothetical protein